MYNDIPSIIKIDLLGKRINNLVKISNNLVQENLELVEENEQLKEIIISMNEGEEIMLPEEQICVICCMTYDTNNCTKINGKYICKHCSNVLYEEFKKERVDHVDQTTKNRCENSAGIKGRD